MSNQTSTPSGVDLDALRAARREANKEAPAVTLGGQRFELPIELPLGAVAALGRMFSHEDDPGILGEETLNVVRELLGDQYDDFMSHRPSMEDLEAMLNAVMPEYGFETPGESPASES